MKKITQKFTAILSPEARWDNFSGRTSDEKILAFCITHTFFFYLIGALYLVAPIVGWSLVAVLIGRWATAKPFDSQNSLWLIKLWILSIVVLEVALIIGHLDFNLGIGKIIKSTIGWAKGWALLCVFIVIGFTMKVRYQVICRAACVVGLIAIILTPFLILAYIVGLPGHLYVSPLKIFGGSGAEFFTVILYEIDPFNGSPRWRFFAPWAPAVGLVANIYFVASWFEKDLRWRLCGLAGNATMIILAASRMGMIVMLLVPITVWASSRLTRPYIVLISALVILILAIFFEPISHTLLALLDDIKNARAGSTRVRDALGDIAVYRWQSEAYWFGHGVVETGTHLVEFMPIGSHHNWYGLLFFKGMVGFLSFFIPFTLTAIILLVKAQYQVSSRLALGICLVLGFFSVTENIEALAYMTWPAWLIIGIGLRSCIEDIDTNRHNLLAQFRLLSQQQKTKTKAKT